MSDAARPTDRGAAAEAGALAFGDLSVAVEARGDGSLLVIPRQPLAPYPERLTDRLRHWAEAAPERVFVAERLHLGPTPTSSPHPEEPRSGVSKDASGGSRASASILRDAMSCDMAPQDEGYGSSQPSSALEGWRSLTYRETLDLAQRLASGLVTRGLSAERPVMILSGNGVDHAALGLACLLAGIPFCPVSPAYALVSRDYGKLRHVVDLLTPGLVFVDDTRPFAAAIAAAVPAGTEIVAARGALTDRPVTAFADLAATPISAAALAAERAAGPDTVAKFLLTSGSTGMPKAVVNTQRMLCANQVMLRETLAFLKEAPPVLVDWLPWNHTFGGNHNLGLVLFNGGTLHVDAGKPVQGAIGETLRNLREIGPTIYFNVPKGYEMLVAALRRDAALRARFFSRLECLFFSAASLPAHIWSALDEIGLAETGRRVPMLTGLGATETAPFSLSVTPSTSRSGHVGLPVPGNVLKLVPNAGKLEARIKGPNVTPGYWRQPALTEAAFDEEGFYKYGDALRPVDPADLSRGFDFDGRISEDFKLGSGTWVSVGPLKTRTIAACAPFVRDVVLAGLERDSVAALVLLDPDGCAAALPHLAGIGDLAAIAADERLRAALAERLRALAVAATGSSTRICRAVILDSAPSIDKGEVTDKGSINQRAVLQHRAELVAALYAEPPSAFVLCVAET